jgi:hypothetical protein
MHNKFQRDLTERTLGKNRKALLKQKQPIKIFVKAGLDNQ